MTSTGGLLLNIRESGNLFSDFTKRESNTSVKQSGNAFQSSEPFVVMKSAKSTKVVGKALTIRSAVKRPAVQQAKAFSRFNKPLPSKEATAKKTDVQGQLPKGENKEINHTISPLKTSSEKGPSQNSQPAHFKFGFSKQKNPIQEQQEKQIKRNAGELDGPRPMKRFKEDNYSKKPDHHGQEGASFVPQPLKHFREDNPNRIPLHRGQEGASFVPQPVKHFREDNPNRIPLHRGQEGASVVPQPMKRFREDNYNRMLPHRGQEEEKSNTGKERTGFAHRSPSKQNNEAEEIEIRKDGYVSSLFLGNPDIPVIEQADVKPVSEKVFSTDLFSKLDVSPLLVSTLEKLGYKSMTTVQQKSIPAILSGKDALVKSQTGSGKTLAYALPIVNKLMMESPRIQRSDGLFALVIVPTRELALQSYQWFERLCKACVSIVPGYLTGGEKKKAEKARLRKGINILVATSGRLIDHIHTTQSLSLAKVKYLVIDEADRLLEMGYEKSVTNIMEALKEQQGNAQRQTIMLSATLSAGVEKLAGMSLITPEVVDISQEKEDEKLTSEALATPENLSHNYILVPAKLRLVTLAAFILSKCKVGDEKKMIIFFATQDMVDYHTEIFTRVLSRYGRRFDDTPALERRAERVLAGQEDEEEEQQPMEEEENSEDTILFQKLHGNMTQKERSAVFKSFREASAGVLMCTDVASRGLDLPRVRWIVQFNASCTAADYVHRVGRTARVNSAGSAVAFLAPAEVSYIQMLEKHKIILKEIKMQDVLRNLTYARDDFDGTRVPSMRSVEAVATNLQMKVEEGLLKDRKLFDLARKAYISFVRAYASYPKEVREMFSFKLLHLGHYAKSMGLRESPSALGATAAFRAKKEFKEKQEKRDRKKREQVMNQKMGKLPASAHVSEFDSGLDYLLQNNNGYKYKK